MHLVDWFRCQATVKVGDQGMTGGGVELEGGIRSQLVAGIWECPLGQSGPTVGVDLCLELCLDFGQK